MQKEIIPVKKQGLEKLAIAAAFVALAACADNVLTKHEACEEQATAWCAATARPDNASCERAYFWQCFRPDDRPDAVIRPELQDACLEDMVCTISPTYQVPPQSCTQIWNAL